MEKQDLTFLLLSLRMGVCPCSHLARSLKPKLLI